MFELRGELVTLFVSYEVKETVKCACLYSQSFLKPIVSVLVIVHDLAFVIVALDV